MHRDDAGSEVFCLFCLIFTFGEGKSGGIVVKIKVEFCPLYKVITFVMTKRCSKCCDFYPHRFTKQISNLACFVSPAAISPREWVCACDCPARPAAGEDWCPSSGCYPRYSRRFAVYTSSLSPSPRSESQRSFSPEYRVGILINISNI